MIADNTLVEDGSRFVFTEDYLFPTPSRAAAIVLGRNANGWTEWKDKSGRTLHEVKRADPDETGRSEPPACPAQ